MKSLVLNADVDTRWGIERWENEGGRVPFGTEISSSLSRPNDAGLWELDLPKKAGEAGLGLWSEGVPHFLGPVKERKRSHEKERVRSRAAWAAWKWENNAR